MEAYMVMMFVVCSLFCCVCMLVAVGESGKASELRRAINDKVDKIERRLVIEDRRIYSLVTGPKEWYDRMNRIEDALANLGKNFSEGGEASGTSQKRT